MKPHISYCAAFSPSVGDPIYTASLPVNPFKAPLVMVAQASGKRFWLFGLAQIGLEGCRTVVGKERMLIALSSPPSVAFIFCGFSAVG